MTLMASTWEWSPTPPEPTTQNAFSWYSSVVYSLRDDTDTVRYIGQTTNIKNRMGAYLNSKRYGSLMYPVEAWVASVPILYVRIERVLPDASGESLADIETQVMAKYLAEGVELLNVKKNANRKVESK